MAEFSPGEPQPAIPWRVIWATIFSVALVLVGAFVLLKLTRVIGLLVVALFFAVILGPPVDFLERKVHVRRGLATMLVFLTGIALTAAMLYAFIQPIVDQTQHFADALPHYVDDAQAGRGTIGHLVKKYKVDEYIRNNQERFKKSLTSAGKQVPHYLGLVASGVVAMLTIFVLSFLMLLEGPRLQSALLAVIEPPRRRERVRRVATDSARAVTGYMFGNVVISVIAGVFTFVFLWIIGVPFRGVLGLWVAFADLIPLVGATLGAIPAVGVAFLHSVPAGIGTIVFFIVYQQFENHVLQVTIMSRTVDLNPLAVLVSVLVGVQVFGIIGALLAIPVAGVIQVIGRDVYDVRRGRLKERPTVGADERPVP